MFYSTRCILSCLINFTQLFVIHIILAYCLLIIFWLYYFHYFIKHYILEKYWHLNNAYIRCSNVFSTPIYLCAGHLNRICMAAVPEEKLASKGQRGIGSNYVLVLPPNCHNYSLLHHPLPSFISHTLSPFTPYLFDNCRSSFLVAADFLYFFPDVCFPFSVFLARISRIGCDFLYSAHFLHAIFFYFTPLLSLICFVRLQCSFPCFWLFLLNWYLVFHKFITMVKPIFAQV